MAENVFFNSGRKVDKPLLRKLNIVADKINDYPTGLARRLLHNGLDELIKEKGIKISSVSAQPTDG